MPERAGPGGVLRELDEDALRSRLGRLEDVDAVAVCLLWGFRHPEHERRVADLVASERPGTHVSSSHETAGIFREHERCATTIVDAALSPILRGYLERLAGARRRDRTAGARGDALERRNRRRRHGRSTRLMDRAVRARRRRGWRRAARGGAAPWASTWAARRATSR